MYTVTYPQKSHIFYNFLIDRGQASRLCNYVRNLNQHTKIRFNLYLKFSNILFNFHQSQQLTLEYNVSSVSVITTFITLCKKNHTQPKRQIKQGVTFTKRQIYIQLYILEWNDKLIKPICYFTRRKFIIQEYRKLGESWYHW